MSSFMLDTDTFSALAAWFEAHDRHILAGTVLEKATPAEMGKKLHALNRAGVVARYGKSDPMAAQTYTHKDMMHCTDIQAVKSLQCLLYQASEGDVPNRKLYKDLTKIAGRVALQVLEQSEPYRLAEWG